MTTTHIRQHNCTGLKVLDHTPENANCIKLVVTSQNYLGNEAELEIVLFDLPESVTDALLESKLETE